MNRILLSWMTVVALCAGLLSCTPQNQAVDYTLAENWYELDGAVSCSASTEADIFYVYPTVAMMSCEENHGSWNTELPLEPDVLNGANSNQRFNRMLYSDYAFYAPYYRQRILDAYFQPREIAQKADSVAVSDILRAFREYMNRYNHGRPFFLVGHSQGSGVLLEVLKQGMSDEEYGRMVAAYLIGNIITDEDLARYPHRIRPAETATDWGTVVVFNSVTRADAFSPLLGRSAVGINPISWTTDSTPADRSMHKGLAKYNDDGSAILFEGQLTGGYLDGGLMVCTDLPDDYCWQEELNDAFPLGNLHFVDSFLYGKDVKDNMKVRLESYLKEN